MKRGRVLIACFVAWHVPGGGGFLCARAFVRHHTERDMFLFPPTLT